ncbi:MAG: formylglycine-generating enzyme family protein, partial [Lentisphaeria bacterium]|nr:formylglycine-generating enzyme family protein [Lentisphaeria bacterium]
NDDCGGDDVCNGNACCTPDCEGKACGPDGCGGTCAPGCGADETCHETTWQCVTVGEFVSIEAGSFEMGSPEDEAGRWSSEVQHTVTLSGGFEILPTEVTQGRFESLMGYNPSSYTACGTDCPVERVNWHEAAAYCNALSATVGSEACYTCTSTGVDVICEPNAVYATPYDCPGYRLPTEAEWEYAARAGTITATYNGDLDDAHLVCEQPNDVLDPIAWFCGNSGSTTHAVGTRAPNDWDLYDMLGNVWEWCHDWHGSYPAESATDPWGVTTGYSRVTRGGSWNFGARFARAASRSGGGPDDRGSNLGFRLVRSIEP